MSGTRKIKGKGKADPDKTVATRDQPKLYDLMPLELVHNTWKYAFNSNGVHHFRLEAIVSEHASCLLQVKPWETSNGAPTISTWRQRMRIATVDHLSLKSYKAWFKEMDDASAMWVAPIQVTARTQRPSILGRAATYTGAKVHVKNDLTVFTFVGNNFSFLLLPRGYHQQLFQGLEHVAVSWKQITTGRSMYIPPFRCFCTPRIHGDKCPQSMSNFVSFFPDITDFYFIYRVTAGDLLADRKVAVKGKAKKGKSQKPRAPKLSAEATIEYCLAEYRRESHRCSPQNISALTLHIGMAEERDLRIWSDCERTFIQVHIDDLDRHLRNSVSNVLHEALSENATTTMRSQSNEPVKFHVVITRDKLSRK